MRLPDHKQKGVVLLLLLLIFLVTGTTFMLGSFNSRQDLYLQQQAELGLQMQSAKESLLAFAANSSAIYANERGPGFFPCPDTTNTGVADATCDAGSVNLGRLPEQADGNKIFFNSHYPGINRQFWYAIAPYYTYSADENYRSAYRRTSIGGAPPSSLLTLDGRADIVALIIAPGEALTFQDRDGGQLIAGNFLEGGNADNNFSFFTSDVLNPSSFNDRVIAITRDELTPYIVGNAAMEIKRRLDTDYDTQPVTPKHYPGNPDDLPRPSDYYHAEFATALESHGWLTDTPGTRNERWAINTAYTLVSAMEACIQFNGYPGISFTLKHDGELIRNGTDC